MTLSVGGTRSDSGARKPRTSVSPHEPACIFLPAPVMTRRCVGWMPNLNVRIAAGDLTFVHGLCWYVRARGRCCLCGTHAIVRKVNQTLASHIAADKIREEEELKQRREMQVLFPDLLFSPVSASLS